MLMSRLNQKQSAKLLEAAIDAGITHFDTARLYGYGEAESALGQAIASRRDKVTVTTKVGILPPKRTPVLSFAKFVARKAAALNPQLRAKLRKRADAMVQPGCFDIPTITKSFETSLRQLGTDYVDFLLLHECVLADVEKPELLDFLQTAQRQGKVRHYGLAATVPETELILVHHPEYAPVLQVPNSVFEPNIERSILRSGSAIFTHSSLSVGFGKLCAALDSDAAWSTHWSERLGIDCRNRQLLGRLALQSAMHMSPEGVVLFASANEANIRANALAAESTPGSGQIETFRELVNDFQQRHAGAGA
jgi:D-threo-aldose 1-dehydrogenase